MRTNALATRPYPANVPGSTEFLAWMFDSRTPRTAMVTRHITPTGTEFYNVTVSDGTGVSVAGYSSRYMATAKFVRVTADYAPEN
ncbi:UNVERIFIED_CONTAM: hypothetical protein IGO34_23270 [Salmonella enterica subsp. enterica serovar Weltevreden]